MTRESLGVCSLASGRHGRGMSRRPGWNGIERQQLKLTPRDYAADPDLFGKRADLGFEVPPGGTVAAALAARVQHRLVIRCRQSSHYSGAQLAERYGTSTSTWSRMTLGQRWAGQLLLCALVEGSLATKRQPGGGSGTGGSSPKR